MMQQLHTRGSKGVCEIAGELIKKYGTGVQRVKISELGVSPLNRAIAYKHVHALLHRILHGEGFSRARYQHALAILPKPDDPMAASRRTNEEAALSNGLLVPMAECSALSLMSKNHLVLGLKVLVATGCHVPKP